MTLNSLTLFAFSAACSLEEGKNIPSQDSDDTEIGGIIEPLDTETPLDSADSGAPFESDPEPLVLQTRIRELLETYFGDFTGSGVDETSCPHLIETGVPDPACITLTRTRRDTLDLNVGEAFVGTGGTVADLLNGRCNGDFLQFFTGGSLPSLDHIFVMIVPTGESPVDPSTFPSDYQNPGNSLPFPNLQITYTEESRDGRAASIAYDSGLRTAPWVTAHTSLSFSSRFGLAVDNDYVVSPDEVLLDGVHSDLDEQRRRHATLRVQIVGGNEFVPCVQP